MVSPFFLIGSNLVVVRLWSHFLELGDFLAEQPWLMIP